MKISTLVFALTVLRGVAGHSAFTNLWVDGTDQGDGTCVRMRMKPDVATDPIRDLKSNDMACGFDGTKGVARVCPVKQGAKLGFEFREVPNNSKLGAIDGSHKGPCSIYMKYVDSAIKDTGVGDGWFKVVGAGYDPASSKWCTEILNANKGIMSFPIPTDLAGGYYLVRPELLSLHESDKSPPDPQFYVGCAQIFLESKGNKVPSQTVKIPGLVDITNPSVLFNIYEPKWPYHVPGPGVYTAGKSPAKTVRGVEKQTEGMLPGNVEMTNANWWGTKLDKYHTEDGCWNASTVCFAQTETCYNSAPPTGSTNCHVWEDKCLGIQKACDRGDFVGPPSFSGTKTSHIGVESHKRNSSPIVHEESGSIENKQAAIHGSSGPPEHVMAPNTLVKTILVDNAAPIVITFTALKDPATPSSPSSPLTSNSGSTTLPSSTISASFELVSDAPGSHSVSSSIVASEMPPARANPDSSRLRLQTTTSRAATLGSPTFSLLVSPPTDPPSSTSVPRTTTVLDIDNEVSSFTSSSLAAALATQFPALSTTEDSGEMPSSSETVKDSSNSLAQSATPSVFPSAVSSPVGPTDDSYTPPSSLLSCSCPSRTSNDLTPSSSSFSSADSPILEIIPVTSNANATGKPLFPFEKSAIAGATNSTTSSPVAASNSTRSPSTAQATPNWSPDETCGRGDNFVCKESCCSLSGWCGTTDEHCSEVNCQPEWGLCEEEGKQFAVTQPKVRATRMLRRGWRMKEE